MPKLKEWLEFFIQCCALRGVGNTYATMHGCLNSKARLVVINQLLGKSIKHGYSAPHVQLISLSSKPENYLGIRDPICFEHTALSLLFTEALREICRLEEQVRDLEETILNNKQKEESSR